MYLFVEALTGLTIRLRVEPEDFIKSIKYKIMVCEDLPIDEQHLIFQDMDLDDNKTLKDYRIGPGTTVRLIMKMKGGPLSPDLIYEDMFPGSEHSPSNNLSDYLSVMLFENGDYKFVPVFGLEKQNPMLQHTKEELNKLNHFFPMDDSMSEHKITILKLKMDYAKLNRKLSSLQLQNTSNNNTSDVKSSVIGENDNQTQKKQINRILCRSMSLDSRPTGLVPDVSKFLKTSSDNNPTNSSRSPSLGIHRAMSVLDTVRVKKSSNTLPFLKDKEKNREILQNFSQRFYQNSFNLNITRNNLSQSRQKLPPLNESEELKKTSAIRRCPICSKRLTLTNEFTCRCERQFCTKHKFPEEHKCTFDFKFSGQLELIKANPLIKASKITKI